MFADSPFERGREERFCRFNPLAIFYGYPKGDHRSGLGRPCHLGSSQMIWSVAIEPSIEAIEQTQFLTPEQKRDIFYYNAARFLRLGKEEIRATIPCEGSDVRLWAVAEATSLVRSRPIVLKKSVSEARLIFAVCPHQS